MDDNARPHRTLAVEELLESEDFTRMDWPAYSPDLNPIENVWDALGKRIAARLHHPENTQQLKQMLIEEWVLLPQEMLHQLVLRNWKVGESSTSRTTNLKEARAPCIAVEMEAIASETASGTNSAREAARRLGLPPSSVRNILRRILQLYPYKFQSCHELLPADTAQREAFAKWAFSKMEQDPTWVFNILWTDVTHFSLHGDVNNHNCPNWATSNPREYTQKPLHSPKLAAWCGFTGSFIIGPIFFETQYPVNGWISETVNAQRYLTLLRELPCHV
ncbi:uncharacterized protein TNCV_2620091 [Trichonephila clavipes]|nr:uncharacterized protein TNCV_2620091 [Trichonephila clavipes]